MSYTKFQPQNFLSSWEEYLNVFLPYMGMVAILFNGAEQFKRIDNIPLREGPMWNLVSIGQAVSKKTTFTDYVIFLYVYSTGTRAVNPGRQNFDCN